MQKRKCSLVSMTGKTARYLFHSIRRLECFINGKAQQTFLLLFCFCFCLFILTLHFPFQNSHCLFFIFYFLWSSSPFNKIFCFISQLFLASAQEDICPIINNLILTMMQSTSFSLHSSLQSSITKTTYYVLPHTGSY